VEVNEGAKILAYYNTATLINEQSFEVQAPGHLSCCRGGEWILMAVNPTGVPGGGWGVTPTNHPILKFWIGVRCLFNFFQLSKNFFCFWLLHSRNRATQPFTAV